MTFNRFILANTEQLHAKIIQMSDRIRQLEDALGKCASDPHPLLQKDFLQIKNSLELYSPQHTPSRSPHFDTVSPPPTGSIRRSEVLSADDPSFYLLTYPLVLGRQQLNREYDIR